MNRTERRATQKKSAEAAPGAPHYAQVVEWFGRASEHQRRGELGAAIHLYKKILAQMPGHAGACEQLAHLYLAQGKPDKASAQYSQVARLMPQSLLRFQGVVETLKTLIPELAVVLEEGQGASARLVPAIAADPYLRTVLESTLVRDAALERWLTSLRASLLRDTMDGGTNASDAMLPFYGALAQQCFFNEYVFAVTPQESELVEKLAAAVDGALAQGTPIDPLKLIVLAMYRPLHLLPGAAELAQRKWPAAAEAVVNQQMREPLREQELRQSMPRLTPISGGVTAEVRQQYEENPYPRWVRVAAPPDIKLVLDDHIRHQFPAAPFRPVGARDEIDILVAGSGTGRNALELAQGFRGARVLAVDLSLASLAYAKRNTPPSLAASIEFAQGDILSLGSIERRFDMIVCSGVLHHMADPLAGWRELIKLMKPDGLMQVGLYSELARRDIVATRAMIAARGYPSTPEGIRDCRQDLLNGAEKFDFMQWDDFFSVSACRDLLFHVHEHRFTIPQIRAFLAQNGLNFVGFEFTPQEQHLHYRNLFARNGWSTGDLDRWDIFERENPKLFGGMYIFWVQKK